MSSPFRRRVATVLLVGASACETTSPHRTPRFLSVRDFEQQGYDLAMEWLRRRDRREMLAIRSASDAVVRFRVVFNETGSTFDSNTSTGVLVDGGRHVLIAGHALDLIKEHPDARVEVATVFGDVIPGILPGIRGGVGGAPEGDWGCVALEGRPAVEIEWLPVADVRQGSTVVVLGYPGELGVDAKGTLRWDDPGSSPPLAPLPLIGRLADAVSWRVDVVAGSQPIGGISGGAIVDLGGRLRAIQVSTSVQRNSATNTESMWFTGTPVTTFRKFLESAWAREAARAR
jgi:hypothetical protein